MKNNDSPSPSARGRGLAIAISLVGAFAVVFGGATAVQAITTGTAESQPDHVHSENETARPEHGGPVTKRLTVHTERLAGVGAIALQTSRDAEGGPCLGLRVEDVAGRPPVVFESCGPRGDLSVRRYVSADGERVVVYGAASERVQAVELADAAGRRIAREPVARSRSDNGYFAMSGGGATWARGLDATGREVATAGLVR